MPFAFSFACAALLHAAAGFRFSELMARFCCIQLAVGFSFCFADCCFRFAFESAVISRYHPSRFLPYERSAMLPTMFAVHDIDFEARKDAFY